MDILLDVGLKILAFVFVLTVLVFVHEWGHYIIARINKVKVDVFSIGFGPEIFGRTDKNGTRWKVSMLPIGGYVKFFGDANAASTPDGSLKEMGEADRNVTFHHKKLSQKAAIIFAGPAANFIFAILILAVFYLSYGQPFTPPTVAGIVEGSGAEEAGLMVGDRIVAIDGTEIETFEDIPEYLMLHTNNKMIVTIRRAGQEIQIPLTAKYREKEDILGDKHKIPLIGIMRVAKSEFREFGPLGAVWAAVERTGQVAVRNLQAVGQIIAGERSAKELGGPITIARVTGKRAEMGIVSLIDFMVMLSIALGLINLFPIPLLDGGHLLYYGCEALLGRALSERTQEFGFRVGLALILGLMVFVTFNDISKLVE